MDQVTQPMIRRINWMRLIARSLAVAWGGFWVWFGLASGISEGIGFMGTLIHTAMPGLILLASAFFAWRWERTGGALLVVEGLIITAAYPLSFGPRFPLATVIFVLLTMALPPIAAGVLFLLDFRRSRPIPFGETVNH